MIKNEKQYKITSKKLLLTVEEIARLSNEPEPLPLKNQLMLASLINLKKDMEAEVAAYDLLKKKAIQILKTRSIRDLPAMIIEFKIISGLTQKEFAQIIGMKEQQLQRYEAENFQGITFKNLTKLLHSIGLEITITGSLPKI